MPETTLEPKKMKVNELKEALLARGLPVSGVKGDLIDRLQMALDEEALDDDEGDEDVMPSPKKVNSPVKQPQSLSPKASPVKQASPIKQVSPIKSPKAAAITSPVKPSVSESDAIAAAAAAASESAKKKLRAERFNLPEPLENKLAARAKRFGMEEKTVSDKSNNKGKMGNKSQGGSNKIVAESLSAEELERRKKRADRFGIVTTEVEDSKKAERAKRFGLSDPSEEDAKKQKRAERFGMVEEESKKKARAERFKTAN